VDEYDPVHEDELIYRRIHRSFFDPAVDPPIRAEAFRPREDDTTGLSVLRALFVQPEATCANIDPARAHDYYVARLSVRALQALGLTVEPDPIAGGPPGHAVIPQLTWANYQANKKQRKTTLFELAKLASADIVHRPTA
jgi:hypothetical protein